MLFSFGTLEWIYFAVGAAFAVRYFYNLFQDYRVFRECSTPYVRNLFRVALFLGPMIMFLAWPLVYVAIFILATLRPDLAEKAVKRKNVLDRARGL
jgi:hypothetical protein